MSSNDVKILSKAIVCEESTLKGDITIASGCVIHPSALIIAKSGPIVFGENCIVEEYAEILNIDPLGKTLMIGANNIFEVGCRIKALSIGDKNIFETKCQVGSGVEILNGCVIGSGTIVINSCVKENSIHLCRKPMRKVSADKMRTSTLQIDFLRKVLPNYHHLRKPNFETNFKHI